MTITKKKIAVFATAEPGLLAIGWIRDDLPGGHVAHVFANAGPGQPFQPGDGRGGPHWPCQVCEAHGYSERDFHEQMLAIMWSDLQKVQA